MKIFNCICLGILSLEVFAAVDDSSPEVYIDVSKRAQQNAVKYDGWKIVGGLTYSMPSFQATIKGSSLKTEQTMNNFMLTAGIEWSKKIKKKFIIGASVLADIWKTQEKTGEWQEFNYAFYDSPNAQSYIKGNESLDGRLKMSSIVPEISVRGGYIFRNFETIAFVKVGAQYMQANYRYALSGHEICSAKAVRLVPIFGIGGYKRYNKKLGFSLELNFPFKRDTEQTLNDIGGGTVIHKIKMGRKTLRVLATYSILR